MRSSNWEMSFYFRTCHWFCQSLWWCFREINGKTSKFSDAMWVVGSFWWFFEKKIFSSVTTLDDVQWKVFDVQSINHLDDMHLPVVTMKIDYQDRLENCSKSVSFAMDPQQFAVLYAGDVRMKFFIEPRENRSFLGFRSSNCSWLNENLFELMFFEFSVRFEQKKRRSNSNKIFSQFFERFL